MNRLQGPARDAALQQRDHERGVLATEEHLVHAPQDRVLLPLRRDRPEAVGLEQRRKLGGDIHRRVMTADAARARLGPAHAAVHFLGSERVQTHRAFLESLAQPRERALPFARDRGQCVGELRVNTAYMFEHSLTSICAGPWPDRDRCARCRLWRNAVHTKVDFVIDRYCPTCPAAAGTGLGADVRAGLSYRQPEPSHSDPQEAETNAKHVRL